MSENHTTVVFSIVLHEIEKSIIHTPNYENLSRRRLQCHDIIDQSYSIQYILNQSARFFIDFFFLICCTLNLWHEYRDPRPQTNAERMHVVLENTIIFNKKHSYLVLSGNRVSYLKRRKVVISRSSFSLEYWPLLLRCSAPRCTRIKSCILPCHTMRHMVRLYGECAMVYFLLCSAHNFDVRRKSSTCHARTHCRVGTTTSQFLWIVHLFVWWPEVKHGIDTI